MQFHKFLKGSNNCLGTVITPFDLVVIVFRLVTEYVLSSVYDSTHAYKGVFACSTRMIQRRTV